MKTGAGKSSIGPPDVRNLEIDQIIARKASKKDDCCRFLYRYYEWMLSIAI
jgi:hypothetical protein